jgi:hypothetical protein
MSIMDGVVQCFPLSRTCEVWWEAWAAAAALAAIPVAIGAVFAAWLSTLVTGVGAWAVYRLGRETNDFADLTRRIASDDRSREATFILASIAADVINSFGACAFIASKQEQICDWYIKEDKDLCDFVSERMEDVEIPIEASIFSRLHVLDAEDAISLARARGFINVARIAFAQLPIYRGDEARIRNAIRVTINNLEFARDQLRPVVESARKVLHNISE